MAPPRSLGWPRSWFHNQATTATERPPFPMSIPQSVLVDEEVVPGYDRATFYAAYPGQIFDGRFELKAKIGWGSSSTVWLAKDISWKGMLKSTKYAALKITTSDTPRDGEVNHEVAMAERLGSANGQHRGRTIVSIPHEAFVIESPSTGISHLCLVFEPLRDPLWLLRQRLCGDQVTRDWLPMFKVFIQILLEGLDYLHSECKVVHTDLKLDNVMMTFEDQSVIERFVQGQKEHPMARKLVGDHSIYRCHNNFGDIADRNALKRMYPKLTDFGLAQPADQSRPLLHPIQPDYSHAPEVLLGTSWSYPADMWNLGTMIWDLLGGRQIFQVDARNSKLYDPEQHLADMIALLGPMPKLLIERERAMREVKWSPQVRNAKGQLCENAAEYFGGPFLTNEGQFVREDLISSTRILENETPGCIAPEDRGRFLSFLKRMLAWLPEDRATAKELKDDPWFDVKL